MTSIEALKHPALVIARDSIAPIESSGINFLEWILNRSPVNNSQLHEQSPGYSEPLECSGLCGEQTI